MFSIKAFQGIEVGLGKADPVAVTAKTLEVRYPDHLILVQAGKFLHAYDRSAYALSMLKRYKLQLVGTVQEPHLRAGFPGCSLAKAKSRLWPIVNEFGIPYAISLGDQKHGYTVYVSDQPTGNASVLSAVSPQILDQVIADLQQRGQINKASARKLLINPDSSGFKLKSQAQELDTQLLQDVLNMPRDVRSTFGDMLLSCSNRIVHGIFSYGYDDHKLTRLHAISADVDMLKFRLTQAQRVKRLRFAIEHRVGLAVELGNLLGGLIRARQEQQP